MADVDALLRLPWGWRAGTSAVRPVSLVVGAWEGVEGGMTEHGPRSRWPLRPTSAALLAVGTVGAAAVGLLCIAGGNDQGEEHPPVDRDLGESWQATAQPRARSAWISATSSRLRASPR